MFWRAIKALFTEEENENRKRAINNAWRQGAMQAHLEMLEMAKGNPELTDELLAEFHEKFLKSDNGD